MRGEGDVRHADDAPADGHAQHRDVCFARAAQRGGAGVRVGGKKEERHGRALMHHAEGDDLRVGIEQADELRGEDPDDQRERACDARGAEDAGAHAFFHAVRAACAQVLADERGQRHVEAGHGQEREALDARVRAAARHGRRAERVDVGLHHDVGERDDAVGQAGGHAVGENGAQGLPVKAELPEAHTVVAVAVHQAIQAQRGRDNLRDGRGRRGGGHAEVQHADEQQIERDVDQRGDDEVVQRMAAVAHGLQNAHARVVEDERQ